MKLGQKIPSGMETGFSVCAEDFNQAWGFQNVFKENFDIKAKISRANS